MIITDEQGIAIAERLGAAQAQSSYALWCLQDAQATRVLSVEQPEAVQCVSKCLGYINEALRILTGEEQQQETIKE